MTMYVGKVRVVPSPEQPKLPAGRYKLIIDSKTLNFIGQASRRDSFLFFFFLGLGLAIGIPFWPGRSTWAQVVVQFASLVAGLIFLMIWLRANPKTRGLVHNIKRNEIRGFSIDPEHAGHLELDLGIEQVNLKADSAVIHKIKLKLETQTS